MPVLSIRRTVPRHADEPLRPQRQQRTPLQRLLQKTVTEVRCPTAKAILLPFSRPYPVPPGLSHVGLCLGDLREIRPVQGWRRIILGDRTRLCRRLEAGSTCYQCYELLSKSGEVLEYYLSAGCIDIDIFPGLDKYVLTEDAEPDPNSKIVVRYGLWSRTRGNYDGTTVTWCKVHALSRARHESRGFGSRVICSHNGLSCSRRKSLAGTSGNHFPWYRLNQVVYIMRGRTLIVPWPV